MQTSEIIFLFATFVAKAFLDLCFQIKWKVKSHSYFLLHFQSIGNSCIAFICLFLS